MCLILQNVFLSDIHKFMRRTLIKFVYRWRKNSRKSGCKGDSETTFYANGGKKHDETR